MVYGSGYGRGYDRTFLFHFSLLWPNMLVVGCRVVAAQWHSVEGAAASAAACVAACVTACVAAWVVI